MSLIRGLLGDCPCPWCMVERECQSNFAKKWPLRNMDKMKDIIEQAAALRAKKQNSHAEKLLKDNGIRELDVCIKIFYLLFVDY